MAHRLFILRVAILSHQSKRDALAAYLAGRTIKLLANGLRPLFYGHYWLRPRQRFRLNPEGNKPIKLSRQTNKSNVETSLIPSAIWQTNYTNNVSLPVKVAWWWNRLLARNYSYCFHTTDERLCFIEQQFPGRTSELYKRLTIGAAQADLWRLLVLFKHGGIYMDIDAHLVWPLGRIIQPETPELFLRYKNKEATNYFIASKPGNPTVKALIEEVLHRIEHSASNNVYEITGPSVFEDVLSNREHRWRFSHHTCLQGNFINKFFQYLDKPQGCWTTEQQSQRVVCTQNHEK